MNEMVERVARVICAQFGERSPDFIDKRWHLQIPVARAVLEAIREPTEAMVGAGYDCPIIDYDGQDPKEVWQAMIDAALK